MISVVVSPAGSPQGAAGSDGIVMLTLQSGQVARLPMVLSGAVSARPQAGQWNRKLAPSPFMRGKLSRGDAGGQLQRDSQGSLDTDHRLSNSRSGERAARGRCRDRDD